MNHKIGFIKVHIFFKFTTEGTEMNLETVRSSISNFCLKYVKNIEDVTEILSSLNVRKISKV